jgi:hypothetical protein
LAEQPEQVLKMFNHNFPYERFLCSFALENSHTECILLVENLLLMGVTFFVFFRFAGVRIVLTTVSIVEEDIVGGNFLSKHISPGLCVFIVYIVAIITL